MPVVVTNQVTTRLNRGADGGELQAALGMKWAHSVNTRVTLEPAAPPATASHITIAKSPCAPSLRFPYSVATTGIELLGLAVDGAPVGDVTAQALRSGDAEPGGSGRGQVGASLVAVRKW